MKDDDRPKLFDVPLVNESDNQPFGSPIIDFAGVRVAHGMRKFHHRTCEHKSLVYNREKIAAFGAKIASVQSMRSMPL